MYHLRVQQRFPDYIPRNAGVPLDVKRCSMKKQRNRGFKNCVMIIVLWYFSYAICWYMPFIWLLTDLVPPSVAFAKLRKNDCLFHVRPSVLPHGTSRLPLEWICVKMYIWVFFENLARTLKFDWKLTRVMGTYVKTNMRLWSYLAEFFLEWEMFRTKFAEKIKIHNLCSVTFVFWKSCRLWDNVEKYCGAWQTTDDNMAHAYCMLDT